MRRSGIYPTLLLPALLLFSLSLRADELAEMEAKYDMALQSINRLREGQAATRQVRYEASLSNLLSRVKAEGNLDHVLMVIQVQKKFSQFPAAPVGEDIRSFPELNRLATEYAEDLLNGKRSRAADIKALAEKYEAALANLQKVLTQKGQLDDATRVQVKRKTIPDKPEVVAALAVVAETPVRAPARPSLLKPRGRTCQFYWSCADAADVYLNGQALRKTDQDFRTRSDEAWHQYSAEALVSRGDVITVGARRGGSYGFLLVVVDEKKEVVWRTEASKWWLFDPKDEGKWYLPMIAKRLQKDHPQTNPDPWAPQARIRKEHDPKAESLWDNPNKKQAFLTTTIE